MADSISSTFNLSIEIPAYKYDEEQDTIDTTTSKTVTIKVVNPKTTLTETTIRNQVSTFLRPTTDGVLYEYWGSDGVYHFDDSKNIENQVETAYTTKQTITVLDIGYED